MNELDALEALGEPVPSGRSLQDLEAVIERGQRTFVEVGRALVEIRDSRLYRAAGYSSFADYCRERWGFSERHADRQITASQVVENLRPIGPTPATEGQVRELAQIPEPEKRDEVWREAQERHGPQPSARELFQVRRERDVQQTEEVIAAADDGAHGPQISRGAVRNGPCERCPRPEVLRVEAHAPDRRPWARFMRPVNSSRFSLEAA